MANPSSIEHVQDAETKAKKLVEDAQKSSAEKMQKARQRAAQIVEEAEGKAKPIKENAIKKANVELQKERERKISDARSDAKKINSKDLSRDALKNVVGKLVRQIFG